MESGCLHGAPGMDDHLPLLISISGCWSSSCKGRAGQERCVLIAQAPSSCLGRQLMIAACSLCNCRAAATDPSSQEATLLGTGGFS